MSRSREGAFECLGLCARFSDQTQAYATVRAVLDRRFYADTLDAERNLAFRIPDTQRETPFGFGCRGPLVIEQRARPMLQRLPLPSPRPLSRVTNLVAPCGRGRPSRTVRSLSD